jgi:hypothetical protein
MPDDLSVETAETETPHPSERELDNTLSRALDEWNNAGARQAETPEPEDAEPEPEKPSRKASKSVRELDEKPDFSEPDDEAEEQDEPAKARKADKKETAEDDQQDRKPKAKDAKQAKGSEDEEDGPKKDEKDPLEAELDKLESPKVRDWKRFKGVLKQTKSELKAEREAREADQAELESYRASQASKLPPKVEQEIEGYKKQIEELKANDIRTRVRTAPDYVEHFEKPITQTYSAILDELARVQTYKDPKDQAQMDAFVNHLRQVGPDALDRQGWIDRVFNNLTSDVSDADKKRLENGIVWLLNKQAERDQTTKQWESDPRTHAQWAAQQQQEQTKEFQTRYVEHLKAAEPSIAKELAPYFPYITDRESREYKNKLEKLEEISQAVNDWSDPQKKAAADARTFSKALFADDLLALLRQKDAELKLLRRENGRMSQLRSIPAKAGGVQGRSKPGPSVDIFENNPFAGGRGLGDDE